MSNTENIVTEIEGIEAINEYLDKLQQIIKLQVQAGFTTGTSGIAKSSIPRKKQDLMTMSKMLKTIRENRDISLQDLPTVNRDVRLLLGQLPGMRTAFSYWFQLRRTVRGAELLQVAPALRGVAHAKAKFFPDEAAKLNKLATSAYVGGVAALAATVLFLGMELDAIRRDVKGQEEQYRDFITSYRTDLDKTAVDEEIANTRNLWEKMWSWLP